MAPRKDTAAVATYGDHEVITPENKLRHVVSERPLAPGEDDPVAEPRPDPTLEHEAVLVLAAVPVERRPQGARRHRVLNQRETAPGLISADHEADSHAAQPAGPTLAWPEDPRGISQHAILPRAGSRGSDGWSDLLQIRHPLQRWRWGRVELPVQGP